MVYLIFNILGIIVFPLILAAVILSTYIFIDYELFEFYKNAYDDGYSYGYEAGKYERFILGENK